MLEGREDRNKLRHVIDNAARRKILTKEEVGFIVTLIERFRADIEKKVRQLHLLQGEIGQLKSNEQIIINLVESMIAAAERQIARQATMEKIKDMKLEKKSESEDEAEESEESEESEEDGEEPIKEDS
jgi:hypothetical protein